MLRSKRYGLIAASTLLSAGALFGVGTVPAGAAASSPRTAAVSTGAYGSLTPAASRLSTNSHATATPDIRINQLCSGTSQNRSWVNIDIITMTGLEDWCYGYTGTWTFTQPNSAVTAFCSGTNHGTFRYRKSPGGSIITLIYPAGYNKTGLIWYPVTLEISGWSGSYKCPVS